MISTVNELTLAIVGSGGDGVITVGDLLVTSVASEGLYAMNLKSYGPQIRGGESSTWLRIGAAPILSQGDGLDVLVVFNWADYAKFEAELALREGLVVLYDSKDKTDPATLLRVSDYQSHGVPFEQLARDSAGTTLAKNIACLGVICRLFNLPTGGIKATLERKFARKGPKIVQANLKALAAGEAHVDQMEWETELKLEWEPGQAQLVLTGNEALSYGALYAGCRFYAGYPITPSSDILEWMAKQLPRFGGLAVQPEDEMAAIGMVLGASFAGCKAMTSTSGPGFSLMCEMIGLACMVELPIVVADIQRAGPSTGIPTKTEQADLNLALYGAHGDAPRVVIAPTDVEDCFAVAVEAFYIAEKYQIPVIILSDLLISQRKETVAREKLTTHKGFAKIAQRLVPPSDQLATYQRFGPAPDGVSPITYPGIAGGMYSATGIEHDASGAPTSDVEVHERMTAKRFAKFEAISKELRFRRQYGPAEARVGVLAWGSSKGAVREAIQRLNCEGHAVSAFIAQILYPLPAEQLQGYLEGLEAVLVVEMSYSEQFLHYVRSFVNLPPKVAHFSRAGGLPFAAREIYMELMELINGQMATNAAKKAEPLPGVEVSP